jgi:hypothetical protein
LTTTTSTGRTEPFSFQLFEGWDRTGAIRIVELHETGSLVAMDTPHDRQSAFGDGTEVLLEIDDAIVDADGSMTPERRMDLSVEVLRTALTRTNDDHMVRMNIAARALDLAARLIAPDDVRTRKMNSASATPAVPASFGVVMTTVGGWTTTMAEDPHGRILPTTVTMFESGPAIALRRLETRVHDVATLDVMERLRLEMRLDSLLQRARAIEAAS